MVKYSSCGAAAHENLKKIVAAAIASGRYNPLPHTRPRTVQELQSAAALARTRARLRKQKERARKRPRIPAGTIDIARFRREVHALKLWLQEAGRPQRKLRQRGREIATVRLCLAEALAHNGKALSHSQLAADMTRRTGRAWSRHDARRAVGWIETLEAEGIWQPLQEQSDF